MKYRNFTTWNYHVLIGSLEMKIDLKIINERKIEL